MMRIGFLFVLKRNVDDSALPREYPTLCRGIPADAPIVGGEISVSVEELKTRVKE